MPHAAQEKKRKGISGVSLQHRTSIQLPPPPPPPSPFQPAASLKSDSLQSTMATATNQAAARFQMGTTTTSSQFPPSELLPLPLPTTRGYLKPSASAVRRSLRNVENNRKKAEIEALETEHGMPIQELRVSLEAKDLSLAVSRFVPAAEEIGIPKELLDNAAESSKVEGVLSGDSKNALPQQNGLQLTSQQFLKKHRDAADRGSIGNFTGYTIGSLGTTFHKGKKKDVARQKAGKAIYDAGGGPAEYHKRTALDMDTLIPQVVREDREDLYGVNFIDKNNGYLDHTNLSDAEYKMMVENVAEGFVVDDPTKMDGFLECIDSKLKENRKKTGVKAGKKKAGKKKAGKKKAGKKVKLTSRQRLDKIGRFTQETSVMRFTQERFDENGILGDFTEVGATDPRRKNAGYRFTIRKDDEEKITSFKFN